MFRELGRRCRLVGEFRPAVLDYTFCRHQYRCNNGMLINLVGVSTKVLGLHHG